MANPWVERLADATQNLVNAILGAKRQGRHLVKSLLNGTWLGHPLHPLLTDLAVGGAVLSATLDIAWLAFPATRAWAPRAAEVTLIVAALGMIGSYRVAPHSCSLSPRQTTSPPRE